MRMLDERGAFPLAPAPQARAVRVVAAGGGTGLPRVLAGFAPGIEPVEERPVEVTAVVTVADDGGSSGRLRLAYGVPPPGDVRNCLVALSPGSSQLAALFQHRFDGDGALAGHTVGNLVLTALAQRLGDFGGAVDAAAKLLGARGRVVPSSAQPLDLVARLDDGRVIRGESSIPRAGGRVVELRLARPAEANPEAIAAIRAADVVVLGPGSLYSSVIASVLAKGMAEALSATAATRVLVVNLFTQPGETDGYDAADHVRAVQRHVGDVVDVALVHGRPLPAAIVDAYASEGADPVDVDRDDVEALGAVPVTADLLAPGDLGRHDPQKLARVLLAIERMRR